MEGKKRLITPIHLNRRKALKAGAASVAFNSLPLLSACSSSGDNTTPITESLKIGLTVPLSGPYSNEGRDQQRGLELAVQHLNGTGDGGLLNTMQPSALQSNGVLGRPVEYVVVDTETRASVAESVARQLVNEQGVSMLVGGSSSGVAIAIQSVCAELGAIHMSALAHSNDVTGKNRSAYAFRQYLNSYISSLALAKTMVDDIGIDRVAYYLTADYSWGDVTGASIRQVTEQLGWQTVNSVATPVGAGDYTEYINGFINSGADVLILVHYGADMVNSVSQARQLGVPDMQINGNEVAVAIPVYTTLMAEAAGDSCAGVYGSMNWHWSQQDDASVAFTSSYEFAYGVKPSEAAHIVYVQTLQYADAVERAGSLGACDVAAELEGHNFSGMGNGPCEYRKADHQCFKDTLVVAGRNAPASSADLLEIRKTIARAEVEYAENDALFAGELGVCNNG